MVRLVNHMDDRPDDLCVRGGMSGVSEFQNFTRSQKAVPAVSTTGIAELWQDANFDVAVGHMIAVVLQQDVALGKFAKGWPDLYLLVFTNSRHAADPRSNWTVFTPLRRNSTCLFLEMMWA